MSAGADCRCGLRVAEAYLLTDSVTGVPVRGGGELAKLVHTHGRGVAVGHDGDPAGLRLGLSQRCLFGVDPFGQQGAGGVGRGEGAVDDPSPGGDVGSGEVGGQAGGFEDGGGLGQCDDDDAGVVGVLESGQRREPGLLGQVADDLAVVGAGGVHEEQGVSGGGGVHDHEPVGGLLDGCGEGLEDGHLFGAGRAKVLGEVGPTVGVQARALGVHDVAPVVGHRLDGIDTGDLEGRRFADRPGEMRGRVGGGQQHVLAAVGQTDGDRRSHRRLPDAAFPHDHNQSVVLGRQLLDRRGQRIRRAGGGVGARCG